MACVCGGNPRLLMPVLGPRTVPALPAATLINGCRASVDLSSQVLVLVVDTDTHQSSLGAHVTRVTTCDFYRQR